MGSGLGIEQATHLEGREIALSQMERAELRVAWRAAFGADAPAHVSLIFMRKALIWRAQIDAFGGLKPNVKQALEKVAEGQAITAPPQTVKAGAQLVREWNGRRYQVEVTEQGFALDGQPFDSLTAVAKHITGTNWSGPRFFGLTNRGKGQAA